MASSSDGVVTATVDGATASVLLTVDWAKPGSPLQASAGNVFQVTVFGATSATALATIGADGSAAWPVRGSTLTMAPGGARTGIDHEAPLGVPLFYGAVAYDPAGARMATSAAVTVTLPAPAAGARSTWLKSLSTPVASVVMRSWRDNGSDLAFTREIAQGVIRVIGRRDPIVVQDVRQLPTGTHQVWTEGDAAADALDELLMSPGPYLLQMPTVGEPDRFVMVGSVTPRTLNPYAAAEKRVRVWSLPLTQVKRPDPTGWSVAIPGKTYADTQATAALYSGRTGTYLSRST